MKRGQARVPVANDPTAAGNSKRSVIRVLDAGPRSCASAIALDPDHASSRLDPIATLRVSSPGKAPDSARRAMTMSALFAHE